MESGYYPPGAEFDSNAPWNKEDLPEKEVDCFVTLTITKIIPLKVNDYKVDTSENCIKYDFSKCDFYNALDKQVAMPHNLSKFTKRMFDYDLNLKSVGMPMYLKEALKDCDDWNVESLNIEEA